MGTAILDLEHVLRSRKEKMTSQEANVMLAWRAQAMKDFTIGFGGGSIVTWLATPRLTNLFRVNFALSAAATCGIWRFGKSVESSVERILSLEGSRIQRELATIMLKKYRDNPRVLQRLSKHFYPEEVYEDSSLDKPVFRWRLRCTSGVPVENHSKSTTSYGEESDSKKNDIKNTTTVEPKQVFVNAGGDNTMVNNPFDLMFGLPGNTENVLRHTPEASTTSPQKQSRREKRLRRRRRRHHHEGEEDPDF